MSVPDEAVWLHVVESALTMMQHQFERGRDPSAHGPTKKDAEPLVAAILVLLCASDEKVFDQDDQEGELMPAVRTYIVTQERETKVTASSPSEAVEIAKEFFGKVLQDAAGPRETRVEAREEF